jgi:hypothetical protein
MLFHYKKLLCLGFSFCLYAMRIDLELCFQTKTVRCQSIIVELKHMANWWEEIDHILSGATTSKVNIIFFFF